MKNRIRSKWAMSVVMLGLCSLILACSTNGATRSRSKKGSYSVLDTDDRVEKYSRLLDELAEQLIRDHSGTILEEYGRALSDHRGKTADELTVDSELFWSTFIAAKYVIPSVYYSRILLLMRDGWLDHVQNSLVFTYHGPWIIGSKAMGDYERYVMGTWDDLMQIFDTTDRYYFEGVEYSENGDWDAAIDRFDAVLDDYPHSCPSLNGKAIALLRWGMAELKVEKLVEYQTLMDAARNSNPFYGWAYQNLENKDELMPLVIDELEPKFSEIADWETIHEADAQVLVDFAAGCRRIGADDYALYALIFAMELSIFQNVDLEFLVGEAESLFTDMELPKSAMIVRMAHESLLNQ